jgi:large subunit ribosomal protein L27
MAHTKAQGSVKGNRDSKSKRLGVKLYAGEKAASGNIIIRQRGTKVFPGIGVSMGKDYTLFAIANGTVEFITKKGKKLVQVVTQK